MDVLYGFASLPINAQQLALVAFGGLFGLYPLAGSKDVTLLDNVRLRSLKN